MSETQSPPKFRENMNSDITFTGKYAIQGNFCRLPSLGHFQSCAGRSSRPPTICPASQSDVSVLQESPLRLRRERKRVVSIAATKGIKEPVSKERLRGSSHLRHHRHHEAEIHRQRPDLPRIAHAYRTRRSE